ncbi:hypothetical protein R7S55_000100 [Raoultella ornithinolytica]|nr:hypothetical protein [Raoultella ornithinolytica]ELT0730439.1 hypothetical protein [Raoultella ornithinolytica]
MMRLLALGVDYYIDYFSNNWLITLIVNKYSVLYPGGKGGLVIFASANGRRQWALANRPFVKNNNARKGGRWHSDG